MSLPRERQHGQSQQGLAPRCPQVGCVVSGGGSMLATALVAYHRPSFPRLGRDRDRASQVNLADAIGLERPRARRRAEVEKRVEREINNLTSLPPADEPIIDVLLPVFNAEATIRSAIASIQNQTVAETRIIVVDDGSTDGTASTLREIAAEETRLLVLTKQNSGITDSLWLGLKHCRAPFLARHDADDLSDPRRLEMELAYLQANSDCVAVSGYARHIDAHDRLIGHIARMRPIEEADCDWIPAREPYLIQPFLLVRRDAFLAAGGYRPLHIAEDSDLYWRLQGYGRLHNLDEIMGSYRIHPGSITSRSIRNGRITALCSQLAALSARRRRDGKPDLTFTSSDADRYVEASSLADFWAIGSRSLDGDERRRLQVAMAGKLIELCFYRPFEPDRADCRFIRDAVQQNGELMTPENRRQLAEAILTTALRLAGKGLIGEASLLVPRARWPMMAARLAFRYGLPDGVRSRLKARRHRSPSALDGSGS